MDYETFIEIMRTQYYANHPDKPKEELIELALTIPLQRGVDKHIAVCSTYINAIELGFSGQAAVDLAVQIAKKNGIDENKAKVAAELGAERYDSTYDNVSIAESSGYNTVDCNATYQTRNEKFNQVLKCKCNLAARPYAAVQWKNEFYTNTGIYGEENIKQQMDYTIFNGGDKTSAVCVGFYVADSLGFYVTSAIDAVAANSDFACIDSEFARAEALKHAQEKYPWYNPTP